MMDRTEAIAALLRPKTGLRSRRGRILSRGRDRSRSRDRSRGKGRGMILIGLSHQSGAGVKGIRRNPSAFEYDQFDLPSQFDLPLSTAPTRIEISTEDSAPNEPSMLLEAQELIDRSMAEIANRRPPIILSTTQLALARGVGDDDDSYIAETAQERTYMRSKTTVKETDFNDRDLDKGISNIDLDQIPPASTAPATSTYIELSTGQFMRDGDYTFEWE